VRRAAFEFEDGFKSFQKTAPLGGDRSQAKSGEAGRLLIKAVFEKPKFG